MDPVSVLLSRTLSRETGVILTHPHLSWLLILGLATTPAAQGGGVPLVVRGGLVVERPQDGPQTGVVVRMLESPTLDRFLRKAEDFLGREDYGGAIKVLQDVLEGNIHLDSEEPAATGAPGEGEPAPEADPLGQEDDPTHAVFSSDNRLYRPVRRLCQELLASLPDQGLALYREKYEVEARRALDDAVARRDVRALEAAYNRYFVPFSAACALYATGDLLMHAQLASLPEEQA